MSVPINKVELLFAIQKEYENLSREIALIPAENVSDKSLDGHVKDSKMSAHNLISYLLGWNELVLKWYAKRSLGESVDFPDTGFNWNELGLLAEKFYQDYDSVPFADLVARLYAAKNKIVELVESEEDLRLYGQAWYKKYSMGKMIQLNSSSPYSNASRRLRRWRKSKQA
nr:ClbS/DfsB family four-helix bundle protein [uncultured Undibacterium sp.]